jgi:mRNA interferase MazF
MNRTLRGARLKEATSLTTNPTRPRSQQPRRGEVWWVDLNPTVGAEIDKLRTAVVISSDSVGVLPIKLIAPITGWQAKFASRLWLVQLQPTQRNGLTKVSTVDTLQLRGVDMQRFRSKLGQLSVQDMEEIAAAIAAVIEYS